MAAAGVTVLAACGNGGETAGDAARTEGAAAGGTVTVYLGRHYGIEPVFQAFTEATGIRVRFTTGRDPELRERLKAEGANTPADLYLAADAGNLALAAADGLLAPTTDAALAGAVPEGYRDGEGRWFGLSRRVRTVAYAPARVDSAAVPATYAALADPRWRGRLCLRPATHPYTQSLVASLIALEGEAEARRIVAGWVANGPAYVDSDTKILEAIRDGACDVGLVNSYYLGRLLADAPDTPVRLAWVGQGEGQSGVHVNVSGAGVVANAPNPEGARRLLAWLATDGQRAFADANYEFPVGTLAPRAELAAWGGFRPQAISAAEYGPRQAAAVRLLDEAGYR